MQFRCSSVPIADKPFSMLQIIQKLSFIARSIFPFVDSITIFLVVFILSIVLIAILVEIVCHPHSAAVSRSVFELPFVS